MNRFLAIPVLFLALACGASKLSRSEAERDIRKGYPVQVVIRVPENENAIKGSPVHANLVALQEALEKKGWFTVARTMDGDHEKFSFRMNPTAPKTIRSSVKGFEIPAAEADFVHATHLETIRDGAKVTYQIRLVRPTDQFALFQQLHPNVKVGETKDRHAIYHKEGRDWVLQETDEAFKKAE